MTYFSPNGWREVVQNIEHAGVFHCTRLNVRADHAHLVCGNSSTRAVLLGHLDDFAHRIIESNDNLHKRYMSPGMDRWTAERDDDVAYFVCRDGNALAYITRAGDVAVNERAAAQTERRYSSAVGHILPAMNVLAGYARQTRLFHERSRIDA